MVLYFARYNSFPVAAHDRLPSVAIVLRIMVLVVLFFFYSLSLTAGCLFVNLKASKLSCFMALFFLLLDGFTIFVDYPNFKLHFKFETLH